MSRTIDMRYIELGSNQLVCTAIVRNLADCPFLNGYTVYVQNFLENRTWTSAENDVAVLWLTEFESGRVMGLTERGYMLELLGGHTIH